MKKVVEPSPFQFHKGAIRTFLFWAMPKEKAVFQFHKGAIRTQNVRWG